MQQKRAKAGKKSLQPQALNRFALEILCMGATSQRSCLSVLTITRLKSKFWVYKEQWLLS